MKFTDWIISEKDVRKLTGFSHSALWREVRAGRFPKPIKLSQRSKGWWLSVILRHLGKPPKEEKES